MPYIPALEQGTTSPRTIDADASGDVATSQKAAARDTLAWAFNAAPDASPRLSGRERAIERAKNRDEADD